jgi:hypothetical protein
MTAADAVHHAEVPLLPQWRKTPEGVQRLAAGPTSSLAAGPAGSAPGLRTHLRDVASLAESKQNTNDKPKAYLTDIMWIITRSLRFTSLTIT